MKSKIKRGTVTFLSFKSLIGGKVKIMSSVKSLYDSLSDMKRVTNMDILQYNFSFMGN